jgi:putative Mg2+ transporter-C (MgtC) family protein
METFWEKLGLELPDGYAAARVAIQLVLSAVLGGLVGLERERLGKAAGLRTHMLVALGSALFVLAAREAGAAPADLTRVIQGVATGIGFVGAGTILKLTEQHEVKGLTTAAGIWLASAVGLAVGLGRIWVAILGAILTLIILHGLLGVERWMGTEDRNK